MTEPEVRVTQPQAKEHRGGSNARNQGEPSGTLRHPDSTPVASRTVGQESCVGLGHQFPALCYSSPRTQTPLAARTKQACGLEGGGGSLAHRGRGLARFEQSGEGQGGGGGEGREMGMEVTADAEAA